MRTVTEIETSVPAFLGKLWKLVEDPETDDLICWSLNGRSFFIRNPAQFARDLLPHYYKHNNMASFVRQLNMYGFHKKVSVELGGLKCDRDEMEFAHQYFIKDHPYLLEHIKRKIATSKLPDSQPPVKNDMMNQVLDEVRTMRGRQEHLDTRLGSMKRENEALWRELAMLRRKHLKQQEIVNKLIHFLVTLVQPNRTGGLSVKRRYPLMIDAHQRHKQAKMSKAGTSPTGPVIHELHESDHSPDSDSEYIVAEMLENHQYPSVQSPKSVNSLLHNGVPEPEQLIEQSLAAGNDSDECLEPQVMNLKRKKAVKPRRKEETVMLDIDTTAEEEEEEQQEIKVDHSKMTIASSPTPIILAKSKPAKPPAKLPVPMKTVRSSKLAALAANINKMNEQDDSDEAEEESRVDTPDINLDDILIVPDMDQDIYGSAGNSGETSQASLTNQQINVNNEDDDRAGSSSGSNDLSLSCLGSSSGTTDAEYRLGPIEEIGSHVNSMQTELERIREKCENGSFDASAFLGLFEDPMFEMMSTELDPMLRDRNSEDQSSAGNELMAYNSSQNLLDIDNDLFQAVENSPPPADVISSLTECYNPDQFDLEDSKALLVDSLLSDANANKSGIS